jgi:hypothetical protein
MITARSNIASACWVDCIAVVRRCAIVAVELLQPSCSLFRDEVQFGTAVIGAVVPLAEVVDCVVRCGERVELEGTFDSRERHLDDARVVAVVFTEQATRVEQTARLPELDHVGVVFIRIEPLLVLRSTQLSAERVLSPGELPRPTRRLRRLLEDGAS